MPDWKSIRSAASKAKDIGSNVNKVKNAASDVRKNGVTQTAKNMLKRKSRQHARKVMMHAGKAVLRFLITPPWGWVTSAIIIVMLCALGSAGGTGINGTEGTGKVTQQQYAALQTSCSTNTSATSVTGDINMSAGKSNWSKDDVAKFSTSAVTSTWKISDNDAASYFLSHNAAVATRYGLTKINIGNVTNAVTSAGVSPVFFYLYAVNEGGGAGGFINHYGSSTGDAVSDASRDAKYLAEWSKSVGGSPATGGGEPSDLPTGPAQSLLDKLPAGAIGRVYIQATSAVTAEIADLNGQTGGWSGKFGKPISDMMTAITKLGGDVTAADQISVSSDKTDSKCGDTSGATGLKSGGMKLTDARKFMMDSYQNVKITASDIAGAAVGSPDIHDNCTAFVAYFLKKYTSVVDGGGDGGQVVDNLAKANNGKSLKTSYTPTVYSVFSIASGGGGAGITVGSTGHTGIVLGIDKDRGVAIIGQANYGDAFTSVDDWNSGVNAQEVKLSSMTKENGWSFVDVSKYVKGMN